MSATTIELVRKAYDLKLENVHILDKYSITEIGKIYNGIGPDRFPDWLREIVTKSAGLFEPAALIHDVEYHEGGTREQFTAANDRFKQNCYTLVKDRYGWYDPRRYLWLNKARRWGNYCQFFGWEGWTKERSQDCEIARSQDTKGMGNE